MEYMLDLSKKWYIPGAPPSGGNLPLGAPLGPPRPRIIGPPRPGGPPGPPLQ